MNESAAEAAGSEDGMQDKRFGQTIVLRVDPGEDIVSAVKKTAEKYEIRLASLQGLGACDEVDLGIYLVAEQRYAMTTFQEEMEMTSLIGNVTRKDGAPYLHLHATFGKADQQVVGGHLNRAVVSGTCEIFIQMMDGAVGRAVSERTGLNVLDF